MRGIMIYMTDISIEKLIEKFFNKGGRINKFYLHLPHRKPVLVYLNGWYGGLNIRVAITKALAGQ